MSRAPTPSMQHRLPHRFSSLASLSLLAAALALSGVAQAKIDKSKPAAKPASAFINDDDVFMALREAALRDDAAKSQQLGARLRDYPIPSYIDYYKLRPR